MDDTRGLFASVPEARVQGFRKGRLSFNMESGRCGTCEGRSAIKVEMHLLSDVWVPCEACRRSRRHNAATLAIRDKGLSIADVPDPEMAEARPVLEHHRRTAGHLRPVLAA